MNWGKMFTIIGYLAGAAATTIATGGIAAPAWVAVALTAVGVVSSQLSPSHVDSVNIQAATDAVVKKA